MQNYIADTHALLWYLTDSPQLSRKAKEIFELSESGKFIIVISIIVLLEILDILEKKKIDFNFDVLLDKLLESNNYVIQDLDLNLFFEVKNLKTQLELHDRVIVTTAKIQEAKIITKDSKIHDLFSEMVVW